VESRRDRGQETKRQRQKRIRRRDRGRRQAEAIAGGDIEDRRDGSQETGRQRQSAGCRRRRDRRRRQAEPVVDGKIEDSRDRGQETRRQSQSAGRGGSSPAKLILRPAIKSQSRWRRSCRATPCARAGAPAAIRAPPPRRRGPCRQGSAQSARLVLAGLADDHRGALSADVLVAREGCVRLAEILVETGRDDVTVL